MTENSGGSSAAVATENSFYLGCLSCTDNAISYIIHSFREANTFANGSPGGEIFYAPENSKS